MSAIARDIYRPFEVSRRAIERGEVLSLIPEPPCGENEIFLRTRAKTFERTAIGDHPPVAQRAVVMRKSAQHGCGRRHDALGGVEASSDLPLVIRPLGRRRRVVNGVPP